MDEEIKPCRICGKPPTIVEGPNYILLKCHGSKGDMIHSISTVWFEKQYKSEAIKAWNRRPK